MGGEAIARAAAHAFVGEGAHIEHAAGLERPLDRLPVFTGLVDALAVEATRSGSRPHQEAAWAQIFSLSWAAARLAAMPEM